MRFKLTDIHIEAAKTLLERVGPCTLPDLVKHLKDQNICPDLDNVSFVLQLRRLVNNNTLDATKILATQVLRGLTINQKMAIKRIAEEKDLKNEKVSFKELAELVHSATGEDSLVETERKIKFLFIPLVSRGNDEEYST